MCWPAVSCTAGGTCIGRGAPFQPGLGAPFVAWDVAGTSGPGARGCGANPGIPFAAAPFPFAIGGRGDPDDMPPFTPFGGESRATDPPAAGLASMSGAVV